MTDRIPMADKPGALTAGGGSVWVASAAGGTIARIDPESATVTQTVRLGGRAEAIAYGSGALWVALPDERALVEVDPATGIQRRTLTLGLKPTAVTVGGGAVWVAGYDEGAVERVDPRSGRVVDTVPVGRGPVELVVADAAVWVANSLDGTVTRLDPATASVVTTLPVGADASALASAAGSLWVTSAYAGRVMRIDPRRNAVTETVDVGGRPRIVAAALDDVWVGVDAIGAGHRGGTLTLVASTRFLSTDPALHIEAASQFSRLAYDTLVTFQARAGPAGALLVPDLALEIPRPTDGGRTYTFRLRPGLRYADGREVRATDFRRAVERLFRSRSFGASNYAGVVGGARCTAHRARCALKRGVTADDAAGTVTFHLVAPDADFVYRLAAFAYGAPIPPGTPDPSQEAPPPPGTGPYRLVADTGREIRFERNRQFREWSHAAQPAGHPDAIVWRFARSARAAIDEVVRGRADWVLGPVPPARRRELARSHASQLHENPALLIDFIPLNLHAKPFDDVRVRRALNYAVDRDAIVRMYGGRRTGVPACQPLVPGLFGYRRYCPYTRRPSADGSYHGPDLARARRLVAASGTRGQRIDVWATGLPYIPARVPAYIARVLQHLGYRTVVHRAPFSSISLAQRRRFQLSVDGTWLPDYPAPSAYLPSFFGCHGGTNNEYGCDPRLDRRMRRATRIQLQDPARAARMWTEIDHALTDQAMWVPTINSRAPELVSERVRNYQYNPVVGFLPDQVWLR